MTMTRLARMIALAALAAAAIGCDGDAAAPAGTADVVDDTTPTTPTPWIYPFDDEVTPALDPSTRAAAIEQALAVATGIDPAPAIALHDDLYPAPPLGSGDLTGCPAFLTYDYGTSTAYFWQGECTAASGVRFSGFGYAARFDGHPTEFGVMDGDQLLMSGRIEAPDGTWLEGSGTALDVTVTGDSIAGFNRGLDGTFLAGGPRAPDSPWLDGSHRPTLTVVGWTWLPTGGKNLTVDGALGAAADSPGPGGVTAVAFEGVTVRQRLAGSTCEDEPGGLASVRGPDGAWYDVLFDGPTDAAPDPAVALCDGCGDTWFRGVDVGPTCVDVTSLFTWPGAP